MARDSGLEEVVCEYLEDLPGLSGKAMFGSWCWLLDGNLLTCASQDGVMVRLGKGSEQWALAEVGITPFINGEREMPGWVLVAPETFASDSLARSLIEGALAFVRALPPK
jgi:TfoX-like protein